MGGPRRGEEGQEEEVEEEDRTSEHITCHAQAKRTLRSLAFSPPPPAVQAAAKSVGVNCLPANNKPASLPVVAVAVVTLRIGYDTATPVSSIHIRLCLSL